MEDWIALITLFSGWVRMGSSIERSRSTREEEAAFVRDLQS